MDLIEFFLKWKFIKGFTNFSFVSYFLCSIFLSSTKIFIWMKMKKKLRKASSFYSFNGFVNGEFWQEKKSSCVCVCYVSIHTIYMLMMMTTFDETWNLKSSNALQASLLFFQVSRRDLVLKQFLLLLLLFLIKHTHINILFKVFDFDFYFFSLSFDGFDQNDRNFFLSFSSFIS